MATLTGWTGKILKVDLSRRETSTIDTGDYVPRYVGGMGIAARIAWDTLKPGIDAFDPENPLFLMVGPLTGTLASGGGRVLVAGIAPQLLQRTAGHEAAPLDDAHCVAQLGQFAEDVGADDDGLAHGP